MIQIVTIIAVGTLWAASLAVVVFEIIIPSRSISPVTEVQEFTHELPRRHNV
ncbi:hypothetical protein N9809_02965 [Amylibacter sp.]|jgi:hypothetical protein|nr:hypothetical protein [Amylibacter sp.]MDA9004469.1 hypothetical protein [Amylibacter sp.]MDA9926825.1 hypothetical protein [Amylibacter sp.]MDB0015407.1 hypothetical protein [Amylibacter sp.]MDB0032726.1 hypothetical protein [Amylibacter sp.]|tara:strand:- start:1085 stop:1240 length:156 start_codon:yes stop_codon:yes gene_type:complete